MGKETNRHIPEPSSYEVLTDPHGVPWSETFSRKEINRLDFEQQAVEHGINTSDTFPDPDRDYIDIFVQDAIQQVQQAQQQEQNNSPWWAR